MEPTKKEIEEKRKQYLNADASLLRKWGETKSDDFFRRILKSEFKKKWNFYRSYLSEGKKIREEKHQDTGEIRFVITNPKTGKSYIRRSKENI